MASMSTWTTFERRLRFGLTAQGYTVLEGRWVVFGPGDRTIAISGDEAA